MRIPLYESWTIEDGFLRRKTAIFPATTTTRDLDLKTEWAKSLTPDKQVIVIKSRLEMRITLLDKILRLFHNLKTILKRK